MWRKAMCNKTLSLYDVKYSLEKTNNQPSDFFIVPNELEHWATCNKFSTQFQPSLLAAISISQTISAIERFATKHLYPVDSLSSLPLPADSMCKQPMLLSDVQQSYLFLTTERDIFYTWRRRPWFTCSSKEIWCLLTSPMLTQCYRAPFYWRNSNPML